MKKSRPLEFDEIGYWSEIKLSILEEYASLITRYSEANGSRLCILTLSPAQGTTLARGAGIW